MHTIDWTDITGTDSLEVPTIYKAEISGNIPDRIWPYDASIFFWNLHWFPSTPRNARQVGHHFASLLAGGGTAPEQKNRFAREEKGSTCQNNEPKMQCVASSSDAPSSRTWVVSLRPPGPVGSQSLHDADGQADRIGTRRCRLSFLQWLACPPHDISGSQSWTLWIQQANQQQ